MCGRINLQSEIVPTFVKKGIATFLAAVVIIRAEALESCKIAVNKLIHIDVTISVLISVIVKQLFLSR